VPEYMIDGSRLEHISIEGVPAAYVMVNEALERVLFDRNLTGLGFTNACEDSSEAFLRHLRPEIEAAADDLAELVILSKGLYYRLQNAFARAFQRNLESNFIATKRAAVTGTAVTIEALYCDFSARAGTLIIGDTIASGATITAALQHYLLFHPIRRVILFSIAGSAVGAQRIAHFCQTQNIDLTAVYGLAAFGLAANGFDLSFLHPDTLCPNREYVERARRMFEGRPVSAVGWDFGSQAQSVTKYRMLCWIEAEYWNLQHSDVFAVKEAVTDIGLVSKERGAYQDRVSLPPRVGT